MRAQLLLTLADQLGMPTSNIGNVDRRLGEAGLISRVPRGHRRASYTADELATVILACMCIKQNRAATLGKIATIAKTAGDLELRGGGSVSGSLPFLQHSSAGGTLLLRHALRDLLKRIGDEGPLSSFLIADLCLSGSSIDKPVAWFKFSGRGRPEREPGGAVARFYFGENCPSETDTEVRMSYKSLEALAEAWDCERSGLVLVANGP